MEILHSLFGFVKSPLATTFLQGFTFIYRLYVLFITVVFSRVWVLWAIMVVAPPVQHSWFLALCAGSWALVEVPRYLFYALNIMKMVPYPLFWLRYSLFAILYPTGITGELGCTWVAAKYLYETYPQVCFLFTYI